MQCLRLTYKRGAQASSTHLLSSSPPLNLRLRVSSFSSAINLSSAMATNGASALSQRQVENKAESMSTSNTHANAWSSPGPAAFDFRSDVVTTPTTSMLNAIASTTLLDDVFLEDPVTTSLESFIAELTGFEAAMLVLSGTMGNQVAIRSHLTAPPHGILCDHRSHVNVYEAGGTASLCGAMVKTVVPSNGHHLTLEDVKANAIISDDVHACPTRVISLENTLNGTVMPLSETRRISEWARAQSPPIIMHLDGARLWEAVAADAGTLKEYSACFDSVSLCFSKGLGAPIGSVIAGTQKFIKRSRWVRKSIGGGLRQAGVVTAAARVAVEETFLGGKLKQSHENAKKIAKAWEDMGGKLAYPVETNMVWIDLDDQADRFIQLAKEEGIRAGGGRLVVHYQIGAEGMARLERAMKRMRSTNQENTVNGHEAAETARKMRLDHVE